MHKITQACDLVMIILSFVSLTIILVSIIYLASFDHIYISQLANNWSLPIPISIKNYEKSKINYLKSTNNEKERTLSDEDQCKSLLQNNPWPGTIKGCYCKGLLVNKLTVGECDSNNDSNSDSDSDSNSSLGSLLNYNFCSNVYPLQPEVYEKWYETKLCTDSIDKNYFELDSVVGRKQDCPLAYRPCGTIDSFGNVLCVKNDSKCPISGVKVVNSSEAGKYTDLYVKTPINTYKNETDKSMMYFQPELANKLLQNRNSLSNSKKLINSDYNHKDLEKLIRLNRIYVEFKVDDDTPCFNKNYYNTRNKYYKLSYQSYYSRCPKFPYYRDDLSIDELHSQLDLAYGSKRKYNKNNDLSKIKEDDTDVDFAYDYIDNISYLNLLDSNKILNKLEHLPRFKRNLSDFTVKLYGKTYTGVSAKCFKEISTVITRDTLFEMTQISTKVFRELLILIFVFIAIIFLFITTIVHYNTTKYYSYDKQLPNSEDTDSENRNLIRENVEVIYIEERDHKFQDNCSLIGCAVLLLLYYVLFSTRFFMFGFDRLYLLESIECVGYRTSTVFYQYYSFNEKITKYYYSSFFVIIMILLYKIKFFLFKS